MKLSREPKKGPRAGFGAEATLCESFMMCVEHRHKISFLILNITLIYQIVKTDLN
jgi:hypothetical protein